MPSPNPSPIKYSILILTYNRVDLIKTRLDECQRVFKDRDDVVIEVLSNGCKDATNLLMLTEPSKWEIPLLKTIVIPKNIGFGPAFNKLAEDALGDILFFVSNDVKIWGDFVTPVAKAIDENPFSLICQDVIDYPAGWNQFANVLVTYPAGYFLACTKKVWTEIVGGFDERFVPHDYEDVDLGRSLMIRQIPIVAIPGLPITHQVAGTIGYSPERMKNTVLQRKRFAEKWGLPNIPERP